MSRTTCGLTISTRASSDNNPAITALAIGSTVGTVMYKAVSSSLSEREEELIARYLEEQRVLDVPACR